MNEDEIERLALFIAHREDGQQWRDDCPPWVRDRYRDAAKAAWRVVLNEGVDGGVSA